MSILFKAIDKGLIPYWMLRGAVYVNCAMRLREQKKLNIPDYKAKFEFINSLSGEAIAKVPEKANEQHYEVPPPFFKLSLGKRLKYSSAYWDSSVSNLNEAEEKMLELYFERGQFEDGKSVLELGCGWGSLTLFLAERLPHSSITAVSNSKPQRLYIESQAAERNLKNITIITQDMNNFSPEKTFDRIVSIEMFEHMRNWNQLFKKVHSWLNTNGKFFLHIFTHRTYAYPYVEAGPSDWMAKYFFSGGMMPSDDLPLHVQGDLMLEEHWMLDGTHYGKTSKAWVANMDAHKEEIIILFEQESGKGSGALWFERWRLFYLACEVLFGFKGGSEWGVSHYRFAKK